MKLKTVIGHFVLFILLTFAGALAAMAQPSARGGETSPPSTIEDKVSGMQKLDGFVPLYWDERAGKLWIELSRFDTEIL